jgi:membrane protease YdiL (CAAX protease family)
MKLTDFIKRHSIAVYFALVFIIAWGGIYLVVGPGGFRRDAAPAVGLIPFVFLAMIAAPSLSSILMIYLVDGRQGLAELLSRMTRWRVPWRWYSVALLTSPLLIMLILGTLSTMSQAFLPGILQTNDRLTLLLLGVAFTFAAAYCEEIGWTGLATPKLLARHSPVVTGLIIGVPWVIWHFLADYWGDAHTYGDLYAPHFFFWVIALPAYRILMTWVYTHTSSVWIAQLMHMGFNASQAILGPSTTPMLSSVPATPADNILWYGIFACGLWVIVGVLLWIDGREMMHAPARRHTALQA